MTVGELLNRMSSREISEWMAYSEVEPFGERWEDLRFGSLAALIANVNRDPKKQKKGFQPSDFFPTLDEKWMEPAEEKEEMPWEKQLRTVEYLNALFGGTDKRKK